MQQRCLGNAPSLDATDRSTIGAHLSNIRLERISGAFHGWVVRLPGWVDADVGNLDAQKFGQHMPYTLSLEILQHENI
jgi:hypothetical protein